MSDFADTAEGTLVVMVCRARHLPNRRKLDKQSPYVLLRVNTLAQKTPAHFRAGQTPEWTHEIRFQLSRECKPMMRVDVLHETKNDPTPIGGTEIDCSLVFLDPANLQDSGKYILDGWYELTFKEKYAGKIFLEMTFYPSAPILPPKLTHSVSAYQYLPDPSAMVDNEASFRHLAPAVPVISTHDESAIFTSVVPPKSPLFRSSNPEPPPHDDSIFVESPRPKTGHFAKLRDKFLTKEPIAGLWAHDLKPGVGFAGKRRSSLHAPSPLDNLDDLLLEMGIDQFPLEDYFPPLPPPHSASGNLSAVSLGNMAYDGKFSPSRSPEQRSPNMGERSTSPASPTKTWRKPPPSFVQKTDLPSLGSTNIPFSADNFQLDAADGDLLPTKVFHMDKPVQSLTVQASDRDHHAINPNEIDPRFYAPTPSEHLSKSTLLMGGNSRFEEREMQSSGYLGEGTWNLPKRPQGKFSPSVFQRINIEENKPAVPPKIPRGLSEKEYYVLDKANYLKDINGRRF